MAQTTRTTLQKGQSIPDFTLPDLNGNQVSTRQFYLRRNLVIAILPVNKDERWQNWVGGLSRAAGDIPDGDAAVLVIVPEKRSVSGEASNLTFLLDPDQRISERFGVSPDEGMLVVADRYGVVFHVAPGQAGDAALDPDGVPGWVEFIACRCS